MNRDKFPPTWKVLKGSTQARSHVLRFGGNNAFVKGQEFSFYYMLKTNFSGHCPWIPPVVTSLDQQRSE